MSSNFYVVLGVLALLAVVGIALQGASARLPKVAAKAIMTDNELRFWALLRVASAPLHVAPQVAMGALLKVAGGEQRGRTGARNSFAQKMVDFVLLDDGGQVRLLVELDDRMHNTAKDKARDAMTASAGYTTLRVQGANARDLHLLKAAIDERLGNPPSRSPPVFNPAGAPRRQRGTSALLNIPPV